jgi:hypothetical protein
LVLGKRVYREEEVNGSKRVGRKLGWGVFFLGVQGSGFRVGSCKYQGIRCMAGFAQKKRWGFR